jgi:hypothetical protein
MSLGLALLLLFVFLAGPVVASTDPPAVPKASAVESFSLLGWVWEWITSLVASDGTGTDTGGGHLSSSEGGMFIDPNGNS